MIMAISLLAAILVLNIIVGSLARSLRTVDRKITYSLTGAGEMIVDVSATMEEMTSTMTNTSESLNDITLSVNKVYDAVEAIANNASEKQKELGMISARALTIYS